LIAAAHAGCFANKVLFILDNEGFVPGQFKTSCIVTIEDGAVISSKLVLEAKKRWN
jgi:osmotically inducible protein OsmC